VCAGQPLLGLLWKILPRTREADAAKFLIFTGILAGMGVLAWRGALPRTRPIVPGDWAVSD
jgi:hypothetical protein